MPGITPPTPLNTGVAQQYPSQVNGNTVLQPSFVLTTPLVPELSQQRPAQDPTKPWMDVDFDSQLPVVPVSRPVRWNTACPAFGFDEGFNVADLNGVYAAAKSAPLQGISVNTQSDVIKIGCSRVDISVTLTDANATCTIQIYEVDPVNGNVLIKQYDGVNRINSSSLFVGGHDQIMLYGRPIVVGVSNITNGASVSVFIQGH